MCCAFGTPGSDGKPMALCGHGAGNDVTPLYGERPVNVFAEPVSGRQALIAV